MAVVGSATIEIRANLDKFNKDIRKQLNESLGDFGDELGKKTGEDFSASFQKSLDKNLKKVSLPDVDTADARASLRKYDKEHDRVFTRVAKRTRSSTNSIAQSLKNLDNHLLDSFKAVVTFGGGFSGLLMTFDVAAAAIGTVVGSLGALVGGLYALSSAIAPAAKSLGILPGLLYAVATGGAATLLSLQGLDKAYKAGVAVTQVLNKNHENYTKALTKYKEELKKLNPQQAKFVQVLIDNRDAFLELKNAASEKIFDGLTRAIKRITSNGFLDILSDGLRKAGDSIGDTADRAAKLTGQTFFQKTFASVMDSNKVVLDNLGKSLVNLISYFTTVAAAARPFTEEFTAWIDTITGNWAAKAKGDFQGLRKSIGDGVAVAKQLGDVFDNIFGALGNIGRAARGPGQRLFDSFEKATEQLERFTGSTKGQKRMSAFFRRTARVTEAIGNVLVSATREFLKLGENPALAVMLNQLADEIIPKAAEAWDKLTTHIGPNLTEIVNSMVDIGAIMAESGGIKSFLEVMGGFLDVIKGILEIPGFAKFAGQVLAISGAFKAMSLIAKFTGLSWFATTFLPALASKKTGVGVAAAGVGKLKNNLKTLSASVAPLLAIIAALELLRTNPITGTGQNPGEGEGGFLPKVPKPLDDFFKNIGNPNSKDKTAVRDFFTNLFSEERGREIDDHIKKWWSDIWAPGGLWEGIKEGWSGIWENLGAWVSRKWRDLKEDWQNIDWADVGKNIIEGIVNGIRSNPLVRIIESVARGAIRKFKDIFGIKSPSKVFERFGRNIVEGLKNGIGAIGRWFSDKWGDIRAGAKRIWTNIQEWLRDKALDIGRNLRNAFENTKEWITNKWEDVRRNTKNIWNNIKDWLGDRARAIGHALRNAFEKAKEWVTNKWEDIRGNTKRIWNNIKIWLGNKVDGIRSSLKSKFEAIRSGILGVFRKLRDGIKTAWNKIESIAAKPVKFIVNTVLNDWLIPAYNKVAGVLGIKTIGPVSTGGGTKTGGSRPASDRGFSAGGYTGPGSKYQPAGVVHADEFVIKKESRKKIEQRLPGVLDYMNQKGTFPGYAGGGLVAAAKWWQSLGARASEHPQFGGVRGGHMKGSLHYSGNAVDLNYGPGGQSATEMAFFDKNIARFRSLFPSLGVLWRVANHFNHMHIDTGGRSGVGKGGGGGILASLASTLNPFKGFIGKMKDGVGGGVGLLGKLLKGAGSRLISGAISNIKDNFGNIREGAGDVVGNIKSAGAKAAVRALAATRGWGGGAQWSALDWLVNKESGWNPAAANPTSSARGLFQKMTSIHGPIEKSAYEQAKWGLDYIAKRYGNPAKAKAFHQSHGYYDKGGRVIPYAGVFDSGGVLPMGRSVVDNRTGGPEHVTRTSDLFGGGKISMSKIRNQGSGVAGQIIAGLVEGIRSGSGAVSGMAHGVAQATIDVTRRTLGIHSPSRVFQGFGLNIVKGLIKGVLGGRSDLAKVIADSIDRITDHSEKRIDALADKILESYRRANQKIAEYNKKNDIGKPHIKIPENATEEQKEAIRKQNAEIVAYNKKFKRDKDRLQVPTRTQAEEMAMARLGFSKAGMAAATKLIQEFGRRTESLWKKGAGKGTDRMLRIIKSVRGPVALSAKLTLGDLARGAEVLASRMERATAKFKDLNEARKDMSRGIAEGISGTFDPLAGGTTSRDEFNVERTSVTIASITAQARGVADKAKTLADRFRKLIKSGMPKSFVQQIAAMGIDDALSVSDAILKGTKLEQKELYSDFKTIAARSTQVGDVVADQMYSAGIAAQRGLIKGLESDKRSISIAAKKLAKRLSDAVKRALGIRSPSKVFADMGKFLPLGLVEGIEGHTAVAVSAVSALSDAMAGAFNPDLSAETSLSSLSKIGKSSVAAQEEVDGNGLTARDRAIIEAIQQISGSGTHMEINAPAEMDIRTLARLVARELEFRGE